MSSQTVQVHVSWSYLAENDMSTALKRVATVIVAVSMFAGCSPATSPSPSATAPASPTGPTASTPVASTVLPTPLPSQPAVVDRRPLGWIRTGEVKAGGIDTLLALDGGYLGWEATGEEGYPVARYTSDGLTWTHADLAKEVTPCPGWTARPDGEVSAGATNGNAVVLVGLEYAPDAGTCGTWQAAAWVTTDGTSWKRAAGFAAAIDGNAWSENVWATPNGWEAAVTSPNTITTWGSTDGLSWTSGAVVAKGDFSLGAHASAPDGTRLLVVYDNGAETYRLLLSKDGQHWDAIDGPPATHGGISRILAPEGDSQPWIVVTTEDDAGKSTIWTSTDLERWDSAPFPMPSVESLAHTTYGLLAFGADPCRDTGGPCDTDPSQYFLSPDGKAWTPLDAAVGAVTFVEGGAGVLGIGNAKPGDDSQAIWRLEPYSADEASLFTGLRPDARFACAARRTDLPAHAIAGVECSPQVKGVERIGTYRFADQADMLDTYFKRLADSGVKPRSGSCPERAGEAAYMPGDSETDVAPYRNGCFVNEFGIANYRFTAPGAPTYVGILGTSKDLAALDDWAWLGNQDVPGSPTVWRDSTP
jgi:hypothetical protein